ncbi:MAG: neutral/alkaline non-lysosomal ceramidase N-terminal domain-containing protein [Candidatus Hydrogenedentes bacterium]|nr:neutral/alkaline non-lysosomal ceramidase N-terminal domain-containing protein [Candidatus Hydrogenedentota bacterium]
MISEKNKKVLTILLIFLILFNTLGFSEKTFKAGFAKVDITPPPGIPMWGYGARHDYPSTGTKIPLYFKVVVFDDGENRIAVGGLDLGRSPTQRSLERILEKLKKEYNVSMVMLVGSHTHHGPVIELVDEPNCGKGKFDLAIKYVEDLEKKICEAIYEAVRNLSPAKIGWLSVETDLNRNRVSKKPVKVRDPELTVVRIDREDGTPISALVNFSAHPVLDDIFDRRWSSDWVGILQQRFEESTGVPCIFLQGSAGDMSPNTTDERKGVKGFGYAIAEEAIKLYNSIQSYSPKTPKIQYKLERFEYPSRMDVSNPLILGIYQQGFFPELVNALLKEFNNNKVFVNLTTVLLNKELALIGGSGEFFSGLALQLKKNSPAPKTIFLGYCNGHSLYIPTKEAVEEGGYGADPMFAWVPVGTGEELIEKACENLQHFLSE